MRIHPAKPVYPGPEPWFNKNRTDRAGPYANESTMAFKVGLEHIALDVFPGSGW